MRGSTAAEPARVISKFNGIEAKLFLVAAL
jgi:hypothetical protein